MKKEKKIEILKERIRLLTIENEQLKTENERLSDQIILNASVEKDGLEQVTKLLIDLQDKRKNYTRLIAECLQMKNTYTEALNQVHKLINNYKTDIYDIRKKHIIDKLKILLG